MKQCPSHINHLMLPARACVYACVHVCVLYALWMHVCASVHVCGLCMLVHVYVLFCVCVHVCGMCACMSVHMRTCVCPCVWHVCVRECMHACVCAGTDANTSCLWGTCSAMSSSPRPLTLPSGSQLQTLLTSQRTICNTFPGIPLHCCLVFLPA